MCAKNSTGSSACSSCSHPSSSCSRVDDGQGEVNQGVMLVLKAAPDPVVVTDVDKVLAGQAQNLERF